jgi:hypothetical protein
MLSGRCASILPRLDLLRHSTSVDLTAPSADVPPATSRDFKLSPFTSIFRSPVIHVPRPLPTFPIPSSTFIDFTPSFFCFFDLSICSTSSIHCTTMIDPPRVPTMHYSMDVDITRPHSTFRCLPFLKKLVFNRAVLPHVAVDFLNVLFLVRGWPGSTKASRI